MPDGRGRLSGRLLGAIVLGTLLNPLNSSMIAVALVSLQTDFAVGFAQASWLVSGFYLAAAVGQPLMGRLADQFGPRRLFCTGLVIVGLTGALAPFAPSFWWLVGVRAVQALGTSAAFPAGMAIIRAVSGSSRPPARALAIVSIANSVSAALGPVLGGFLVALAGWPAIFVVNVAVTLVALPLALRWLPTPHLAETGEAETRESIDLLGIVLFAAMLIALLGFLLSLSDRPRWALLAGVPVAAALLLWRELAARSPFVDVRMLARRRALLGVYAQYVAVNIVFYGTFFGLPLWLERGRGFAPDEVGLLVLPLAGLGVLATPVAARLISRAGVRPALIVGAVALTVGSLALLVFGAETSVVVIVAVSGVLGIPNGFNNLGLQAALYEDAPPRQMGSAAGLFQTSRYVGAILSTSLLGVVFGSSESTDALHETAYALAAISLLLVLASVAARRGRAESREDGHTAQ